MPLLAGDLICQGVNFYLREVKTQILYPLAYHQVLRLYPEFKYHDTVEIRADSGEKQHCLTDSFYFVDTCLDVPRWRFVKADDLFQMLGVKSREPDNRVVVGYAYERNFSFVLESPIFTEPFIFSQMHEKLILSEYIVICLQERINEWGKVTNRYPSEMVPVTIEDYYKFLEEEERIAKNTPPSIAIN